MPQERAVHETRLWLERAVIGLNLCPFAKAVHVKGLIHYAVSNAVTGPGLLADFAGELDALVASDPSSRDTTLLIAPLCMRDFLAFNDLVGRAERVISRHGLDGEVQLASFHPGFQFAGTQPTDISNFTNRSPYPTLHLLREKSVERAVAAFPHAEAIYEANIATLRQLGHEGWAALGLGQP